MTIEAGLTSFGELAAKAMRGQSGIPLVELEIAPELAIAVLHPAGIDCAVSGRRGRDPGGQGGTQRFQITQVSNESLSGCGEIRDLDAPPEMSSTCLRFGLADKKGVGSAIRSYIAEAARRDIAYRSERRTQ